MPKSEDQSRSLEINLIWTLTIINKTCTNLQLNTEFGSAARLSSVWNCLWGHELKRSPGINRKSRVSYTVPGFLSSATWPLLPKKHYNGLIN